MPPPDKDADLLLLQPNPSPVALLVTYGCSASVCIAWLMPLAIAFAGPGNDPRAFRLPAGPANETLRQFAEQAEREILFPSDPVADVRTQRVVGDYPPREAIDRMLEGTRLRALEAPETGGFVLMTTRGAHPVATQTEPPPAKSNPSSMKTKSIATDRKSTRLNSNH